MSAYYSIAFGKAPGGKRGNTHTFAVWFAEPTREPFRAPDAFGGAISVEEARTQAEYIAGRVRPGEPIVELKPEWARAARFARKGEPPWPKERNERRSAQDRRLADFNDEEAREDIAEWASELSEDTFRALQGCVVRWIPFYPRSHILPYVIRTEGDKTYAVLRDHALYGDRKQERYPIDPAELARDGKVWVPKMRGYLYSMPSTRNAQRARARRETREVPPFVLPRIESAFATLGLPLDATEAEIRRAYRRIVAKERAHPDQGGHEARFIELTAARDAAVAHAEGSA